MKKILEEIIKEIEVSDLKLESKKVSKNYKKNIVKALKMAKEYRNILQKIEDDLYAGNADFIANKIRI